MEKALSVRAPWWWFILHGGKDIENRNRPTKYRGPIYIHASKWWSKPGVIDDAETALECYYKAKFHSSAEMKWAEMKSLGGHIVGKVDIVDCVTSSASPWFFGKYGYVLANPVALERPIACVGMLGLFNVELPGISLSGNMLAEKRCPPDMRAF